VVEAPKVEVKAETPKVEVKAETPVTKPTAPKRKRNYKKAAPKK
jgi:hypothetical protein